MEESKQDVRFYGGFGRFARWVLRTFSHRYEAKVQAPEKPTVYVCRHLNMHGPYTTLKWLPFHVHVTMVRTRPLAIRQNARTALIVTDVQRLLMTAATQKEHATKHVTRLVTNHATRSARRQRVVTRSARSMVTSSVTRNATSMAKRRHAATALREIARRLNNSRILIGGSRIFERYCHVAISFFVCFSQKAMNSSNF